MGQSHSCECDCESARKQKKEEELGKLKQLARDLEEKKEGIKQTYAEVHIRKLVIEEEDERKKQVELKRDKWLKHYSSSHKILLVGEGDFSFSFCLANAFGSASNIVATSLDSAGKLMRNYEKAISNICELKKNGCNVIHGVDAMKMMDHFMIRGINFDRIIFNFPHVAFSRDDSREAQITRNQKLVYTFFENAKTLLSEEGEIHVTNKSEGFFGEWNIVTLASLSGLRLVAEMPFQIEDYPGYSNKYGFGYNCDKNFDCNPSSCYKFKLQPLQTAKRDNPWEHQRPTGKVSERW